MGQPLSDGKTGFIGVTQLHFKANNTNLNELVLIKLIPVMKFTQALVAIITFKLL